MKKFDELSESDGELTLDAGVHFLAGFRPVGTSASV